MKYFKTITVILVALAVLLLGSQLAWSETVGFTYDPATEWEDGTPLRLEDILETRLYCNGSVVASEPGADGNFSVDLPVGVHICKATHVGANNEESLDSNTYYKTVLPSVAPKPPGNLTAL